MKLLAFFLSLLALPRPTSEYCFCDLLDAIAQVESGGDPNAVGDNGAAVGLFQIHKIYVDDVNRILRYNKYKYSDRLLPHRSQEMVTVYLKHYGKGKSLLDMARIHNGGPRGHKKKCTLPYAEKIRKEMAE